MNKTTIVVLGLMASVLTADAIPVRDIDSFINTAINHKIENKIEHVNHENNKHHGKIEHINTIGHYECNKDEGGKDEGGSVPDVTITLPLLGMALGGLLLLKK